MIGGQVGTKGHMRIGDNVVIAGQSGVWGDRLEPGVYSGNPARPHKDELKSQATLARLPRLMQRLRALEQAVFGRKSSGE